VSDKYSILDASSWETLDIEAVGSRNKKWYQESGNIWLFKEPLRHSTEVWTEKVASELAELLDLPHARYEIGQYKGLLGSLSHLFLRSTDSLVLGNQLMNIPNSLTPGERRNEARGVHTVERFLELGDFVKTPLGWTRPVAEWRGRETMIGYLMFDAWIANTDRHEQNWGWVVYARVTPDDFDADLYLAPTFDHTSCLGWDLTDEVRSQKLREPGSITDFAKKAKGEFYVPTSTRKLKTFEAFQVAARLYPAPAKVWLERLKGITSSAMSNVMERVPSNVTSEIELKFALELLKVNQKRLVEFGATIR
jgi:hypothetical protein